MLMHEFVTVRSTKETTMIGNLAKKRKSWKRSDLPTEMVKKKASGERESTHDLQRKLSKALRGNNEALASDLYVELGEEYRRLGDLKNALNTYNNAAELAERINSNENAAYAHRAIAEICVDPDIAENKRALEHGRSYLEAANKTGQVHLIQLAYHVLGWLYLQVYLNSANKHNSLLEKMMLCIDRRCATDGFIRRTFRSNTST